MNPVTRHLVVRQVVLGLILGTAISVFPIEISLLGGCGVLIFLSAQKYWVSLSIAVVVCFVAVQLPFHRLDRKVGPFAYGPMKVDELVKKLREEQGVPLMVVDDQVKGRAIEFSVAGPMTRREVLEKIAAETNTKVSYKGCGNGATLLFGSSKMAFLSQGRSSK